MPNTFNDPKNLSCALAEVVGAKQMSRPQVTKKLWVYIKANNLQKDNDKRIIRCDNKLQAIFKLSEVHMMKMAGLLKPHFLS